MNADLRNLRLCHLCELLVHFYPWHEECQKAYRAYIGTPHRRRTPEPPNTRRGRPRNPATLIRNVQWLLQDHVDDRVSHDAKLRAARHAKAVNRYHRSPKLDGSKPRKSSDTSLVSKGKVSALQIFAGSWDVMFSEGRYRRWTQRKTTKLSRTERNRRYNDLRQKAVPLPDVLRPLIDAEERDPLIRRLAGYRMPLANIQRVTGAPLDRIARVVAEANGVHDMSPPTAPNRITHT